MNNLKFFDRFLHSIWLQVIVLVAALWGLVFFAGKSLEHVEVSSHSRFSAENDGAHESSEADPAESSSNPLDELFNEGSGAFGDWDEFSDLPKVSNDPVPPRPSQPAESEPSSEPESSEDSTESSEENPDGPVQGGETPDQATSIESSDTSPLPDPETSAESSEVPESPEESSAESSETPESSESVPEPQPEPSSPESEPAPEPVPSEPQPEPVPETDAKPAETPEA